MEKLHLYFGLSGDNPVSHTSTHVPGAYAGHLVAGPVRLIQWLELHLGCCGVFPTTMERAIRLKDALNTMNGNSHFFSASFKSDPLAVATRLLVLWDSWRMSGWNELDTKKTPARMKALNSLGTVFNSCGPGLPERIRAILTAMDKSLLPPLIVHVMDEKEGFPILIREVLSALEKQAAVRFETYGPNAAPGTDLRLLQDALTGKSTNKSFRNDHSLQFVFFNDDIAEAHAVYSIRQAVAWNPLIISGDNSLLNGLCISGNKPVSHWRTTAGNGQVSQLFFLATALFKRPVNSSQVISLLAAPVVPFPKKLATSLAKAFSERPGFGNADWNNTISEFLAGLQGDQKRESYSRSIAFWLQNEEVLQEPFFEVALLVRIYSTLGSWAVQSAQHEFYKIYVDQLFNLSGLCGQLVDVLKTEGEKITAAKFDRLQTELFAEVSAIITEAEIGSADMVSTPDAVWSPAKEILWMSAARFEPGQYLAKYWYQEEKEWFIKNGLPLQDESVIVKAYNDGVKRLVLCAKERLVVSLPLTLHGAGVAKPFCLDEWDQLVSLLPVTVKAGDLLATIPWREEVSLLTNYPSISLPVPVNYFSVKKENFSREKESYSSLAKLLQHPAEWYIEYRLRLKHHRGIDVPNANIIKGVIADRVVQVLFTEAHQREKWWKSEDLFRTKVIETADEILLQEGLPFLENKAKRQLTEYKRTLVNSLCNLREFISNNKFQITATQHCVSGNINGIPCEGFIDLLLASKKKNIVLDLKWAGSSKYYREGLRNGTDLQLVIYASLLDSQAAAGYFMLNDGNVYMRGEKNNSGYELVKYETPEELIDKDAVLASAIQGINYRQQEMASGKIEAGYRCDLQELDYYRDMTGGGLYPLAARNNFKQAPFSDDLYLFFGEII